MSGRHAMAVRLTDGLGAGSDQSLNDVCITFAESLVSNAAGVIAGAKPAAIFSIPMRAYSAGKWRRLVRQALDEALRAYAEMLPAYGMRVAVLHRTDRRVFLLVWRDCELADSLGDPEAVAILREQGYEGVTPQELLCELRRRLVGYYHAPKTPASAFPHEIGDFLGYPPEDVRGFMEGKEATCRGAWHAYGDEHAAKRRFRALEAQERRCRSRFAVGEPLHALFAAQPAI